MTTKKPTSNTISIAIIIGSFIIAVGFIFNGIATLMSPKVNPTQPKQTYENISYVKVDESPTLGNKDAPITVIEYTDFDCPICKVASDEVLPQLKKEYIETGKVKFVFKSLPLEYLHPNAFHKTEAAFCAREQGGDAAFFKFYDSLFMNFGLAGNLDDELTALAEKAGMDGATFRTCLTSKKYKDIITKEVLEGNLIGSLGTPTWLIGKSTETGVTDAVKLSGLLEYTSFKTIIDELLE